MSENGYTALVFRHPVRVNRIAGTVGGVSAPPLDVLPPPDQRRFVEHLEGVIISHHSPRAATSPRFMQSMNEILVATGGNARSGTGAS
jgi:hypothetical protein